MDVMTWAEQRIIERMALKLADPVAVAALTKDLDQLVQGQQFLDVVAAMVYLINTRGAAMREAAPDNVKRELAALAAAES